MLLRDQGVLVTRLPLAVSASRLVRLLALLAFLVAGAPSATSSALAQDAGRNPADVAITNDEAGKSILSLVEKEGDDDYGRWIQRRWERDRDNEDVRVGPIITDNTVWVAKDVQAAQALFKEQAGKLKDFPESVDKHKGPYAWEIEKRGDEIAALSACDDCGQNGGINLHHRVVMRQGNVVTVLYIYGRESVATQGIATYFVERLAERL